MLYTLKHESVVLFYSLGFEQRFVTGLALMGGRVAQAHPITRLGQETSNCKQFTIICAIYLKKLFHKIQDTKPQKSKCYEYHE